MPIAVKEDKAPATQSSETVHTLDKSITRDPVNLASAESMDASDPPPFNPGTAAPSNAPPMNDQRIKPNRPISLHP